MNSTAGIFTASSERDSVGTLCRLCLKINDYYYNVFTCNVACRLTAKDAINGLLGIEVAVGDGLPTTLCPLCLKKLTELSVFKITCLESDAKLRKLSGANCFMSIQGDEATDDEQGFSADTKDFIQDEIQGTSHLTHSVQRTEIYIPVSDSQQPGANMLVTVKEENEDPLSGGNYPVTYTQDPDGILSKAVDPLATDDLSDMRTCGSPSMKANQFSDDGGGYAHSNSTNGATNDLVSQASDQALTSTSSPGEEVDAEGTGAIEIDLYSVPVLAKEELSLKETDATEPTSTENRELIQNKAVAMESMTEAVDIPASEKVSDLLAPREPKRTASNSRTGRRSIIRKELLKANLGGTRANKSVREVRRSFIVDGKTCTDTPHTARKPYSCSECEKSFSRKSHLVHHIRTHTKEKPYSCSECQKSFSQKSHLIYHIQTHTKVKLYSCGECEKSFTYKSELVRHIRTHTKEKPYTCSECEKSFSDRSNLVCHMRIHTNEKPYSCGECEMSFSRKSSLFYHIKTHTKERSYSCGECEKSFYDRGSLVRHIRTHTKEKPYSCGECEKSFFRKSHLVRHIRTHTNEKPYSCSECQKSFSQKSHLIYHIRTHTKVKLYSCGECEKSFSYKSDLVRHIRTHTKEKPYTCSECEKSFSDRSNLVCHMRIHTNEKPYSCGECEMSFSRKSRLVNHIKTHTKEKPYSCGECEMSFSEKSHFVRHIRT